MRLIMNKGQNHTVFGKEVKEGEEFEVPDNEGQGWIALGMAAKSEDALPPLPRRKGRYHRSDMRAEED